MNINLGDADAGVAIAISVISDYMVELQRIGNLPASVAFQRTIGGLPVDITVLLDAPVFELARPANRAPYTRLLLTGTIESRPAGLPNVPPITFPLDTAVLLTLVLVPADPVAQIGFRYDGVDGTPSPPVTSADIDEIFNGPDVATVLNETRIDIPRTLVEGLNVSRFGDPPAVAANDWDVKLTLMPAGSDTVDAFAVTAAAPSLDAAPPLTESFMLPNTGLAVAYNRAFLDLMLERGGNAQEGQTVDDAEVRTLEMEMSDTAIEITKGHVVRPVDTPIIDILPDVDIRFHGPMVPSLVRGTTGIAFDASAIKIDIDDSDEVFIFVAKWFLTIGAAALLFTGWASLTALGILLWITLVQKAWNGDAELDNAPNVLRDSLATALGAQLSLLADALDDDTDVGELRIDATPDSLLVLEGNVLLFAQILVVPLRAGMRAAEYSNKLRRFVIFELEDGRRFRAQELARLMKAGKITVPGFHQVAGNYLRANPDDVRANNLLQTSKENLTSEVVVKSKR